MKIECKFYDRKAILECSEDRKASVPGLVETSLIPRGLGMRLSEDGKWGLCIHTCVYIPHIHTHLNNCTKN